MEMDWALGIFTIMTIMAAVILVIITSRFAYLDPRYAEIIKNYEFKLVNSDDEGENELEGDENELEGDENELEGDENENKIIWSLEIGKYRTKREDNRNFGFKLDVLSLVGIMFLGCLTVFGIFESFLFILIVLLFLFSFLSLIHFRLHLSTITKKN